MANAPLVSVLCLTYNQAPYVRQMLDGILTQDTSFTYEILINDDASDDGTVDIINEYQQKYPKIIKPVFQKENLYSQGLRNFMVRFLLPNALGKYIAICEGDDYWTDNKKLQLQVDYMERHPDAALCFHPVRVFFENNEEKESIFPDPKSKIKYTKTELIKQNFIQTNSVMYRKQKYENMQTNVTPGDWYLHLYHAQFGKIGFIDRVMADYRRHAGGIWWNSYKDPEGIWEMHGIAHLALYEEMLNLNKDNPNHIESIRESINTMLINLIDVDKKYDTNLFEQAIHKFPNMVEPFALYVNEQLNAQYKKAAKRDKEINQLHFTLQQQLEELENKKREIYNLKQSRFWKLRNIVAKSVGKPTI